MSAIRPRIKIAVKPTTKKLVSYESSLITVLTHLDIAEIYHAANALSRVSQTVREALLNRGRQLIQHSLILLQRHPHTVLINTSKEADYYNGEFGEYVTLCRYYNELAFEEYRARSTLICGSYRKNIKADLKLEDLPYFTVTKANRVDVDIPDEIAFVFDDIHPDNVDNFGIDLVESVVYNLRTGRAYYDTEPSPTLRCEHLKPQYLASNYVRVQETRLVPQQDAPVTEPVIYWMSKVQGADPYSGYLLDYIARTAKSSSFQIVRPTTDPKITSIIKRLQQVIHDLPMYGLDVTNMHYWTNYAQDALTGLSDGYLDRSERDRDLIQALVTELPIDKLEELCTEFRLKSYKDPHYAPPTICLGYYQVTKRKITDKLMLPQEYETQGQVDAAEILTLLGVVSPLYCVYSETRHIDWQKVKRKQISKNPNILLL